VAASLDCATVLLGGSPGSGKSVAVWSLLLGCLRDPLVSLVILDLKPSAIETAALHDRAEIVADNTADAANALRRVWLHIEATNADLRARRLEKVPAGSPRVVIVVDEAAELAWDDDGREAAELLQRIVAVGRASGVSVIMATQKPSGSVIPTDLRDLFAQRLCFRVGNRAQAETVLGPLAPTVEPWAISTAAPGTGYAVGTVGETAPVRFRGYDLTDDARAVEAEEVTAAWVNAGSPTVLPTLPSFPSRSDDDADGSPRRRRRR
jgi:DNA segregation ATPase FtsK/SpoIIIE-like protein